MASPRIPRDGTITVEDDSGTPISYTVLYEDGDYKGPEMMEDQSDIAEFYDRQELYAIRKTQRKSAAFSFSAHLTDVEGWKLKDAFSKTGAYSSGVSTSASYGDVWTVKVTWTDGTLSQVLPHCHGKVTFSEGEPGKVEVSGTVFFFTAAEVAALTS
tara:strand:+ start:933 stop:1403 length:471 start_codon:yes stop_codon:yes gene_type:complete